MLNSFKKVRPFFSMPSIGRPHLIETWLTKIKLPWFWTSLGLCLAQYGLLIGIASLQDMSQQYRSLYLWEYGLYPLMTLYLLLIQPILRHLQLSIIRDFMPLLPMAEQVDSTVTDTFVLNRQREWLAIICGASTGFLLTEPWGYQNLGLILYSFLASSLNFGLLGWTLYNTFHSTHALTELHNQTRGLDIHTSNTLSPLRRWGLAIGAIFILAIFLAFVLVPHEEIFTLDNILIYIAVTLVVGLVFLQSNTSDILITQLRLLRAFAILILVALTGTLGYHYLEGWDLADGLFMTVITMTTIGYGEVQPLDEYGRLFTILLSIMSVGIAGYAISATAAFIIEGHFNHLIQGRQMNKQIAKLTDHIVLCGAGHVGLQIAAEFQKTHTPFVIIEQTPDVYDNIDRFGDIPRILGDATKDEILYLAGIDRACGLVAALSDDKENAFVVLSARSLNPKLRIVARLTEDENAEKLRKAGADEIVAPSTIGGLRMASVMIRPTVVTFLDEMLNATKQTLRIEEAHINPGSGLVGKNLVEADIGHKTGTMILAIRSENGSQRFNPPPKEVTLKENDILIVIGTPEQVETLRDLN